MDYDQVGAFWDFVNYVFRPDALLTAATGTGIATAVTFIVFIIMYWLFVSLLTRWYRRYSKTGVNFHARFKTIREVLDVFS